MRFNQTILLPIGVCIFIFLLVLQKEIQAKTPNSLVPSKPSLLNKNAIKIIGFRSARFGMTEREVLKSIFKDYGISKSKIQRRIHPKEKTMNFNFGVNDLLPNTGLAKLFYVFGFKTKRLIQVNILWDKTSPKFNPQTLVDTANHLRLHFLSQGFQKNGLTINSKLPDGSIIVFRGVDLNGKMVALLLVNPPPQEGQPPNQNINLRLSYIANPDSPDIFKIKKDDF